MSLGKKVFSSAFLLLVRKIWGNLVNLVVMAFLARLLSKEDFGLLAISSVFLNIINTVATSGIAEYVVQYDGEDRGRTLNAAFWLNLYLTLGVIFITVTTGPWWAEFYSNPKIYELLLMLTIAFFFEMNIMVPRAILRKELEYKTIVFYSGIAMTVISVGKLMAAFAGFGVYSLILPQIIVSPFLMISFFVKAKWKPSLRIDYSSFKPIFNFSKHVIGGRVLTKFVSDGDNLIAGKLLGMEALGIYSLAFQLANLVTGNVVLLAGDLFLPLFSKIKQDVVKLRHLYLRMIQFLSFISFPLITLLIVGADPVIYFIYGEKWLDTVAPLQILCLFALARSISSPSSSLYSAVGRPDIGFKFAFYFAPFFLMGVFVGAEYGVVGLAIATTVTRVCGSIVSLNLSLSLIKLKLGDLYRTVRSNLITASIIAGLYFLIFLEIDHLLRWYLIVAMPIIFYVYFLMLRFFFKDDLLFFLLELERYVQIKYVHAIIRRLLFLKTKFE